MPSLRFFMRAGFGLKKGKLKFLALINKGCLFPDNLDISAGYNTFDDYFSGA